jgi:hypothetical protein
VSDFRVPLCLDLALQCKGEAILEAIAGVSYTYLTAQGGASQARYILLPEFNVDSYREEGQPHWATVTVALNVLSPQTDVHIDD